MCHNSSLNVNGQQMHCNFKQSRGGALSEKDETKSYLENDKNTPAFQNQLEKLGLEIRDIVGDGNCLFRSLADQMDGQSENHLYYREKVCEYIEGNRDDFEPFLLDKCNFEDYVKNLKLAGTYAGNDAIVGFAKLFSVNIVIHQLSRPMITISGNESHRCVREIHISYHNNEHYASVRYKGDLSDNPTKFITNNSSNSSCSACKFKSFVNEPKPEIDTKFFKRKTEWHSELDEIKKPKTS